MYDCDVIKGFDLRKYALFTSFCLFLLKQTAKKPAAGSSCPFIYLICYI